MPLHLRRSIPVAGRASVVSRRIGVLTDALTGGALHLPRRAVLYGTLSLASGALFLPWVDGYFVGDDWMIIARNLELPWAEVPGWFFQVRHDWYRPVFELFVAVSWRMFGVEPVAYHLLSLSIFVLVVAQVGLLGERLSGDWRVGLLALALFGALGCHGEPVLWFAAASDLIVAVFLLASLAGYLRFRRTNRHRWLGFGVASFFLALASKETAVVLPLVWLAYEQLCAPPAGAANARRKWWPALLLLVPSTLFVVWRLILGNPYLFSPTRRDLVENVGHYFTLLVTATPVDFDYTAAVPLWQVSRLLPLATTSLATLALAAAALLWLRWGQWRRLQGRSVCLFAIAFAALTLAPVLPIVSERTAFLPSVGLAWALAALAVAWWDEAQTRGVGARQTVVLVVALFMAAQLTTLVYRGGWWGRAGQTSRRVLSQLESELDAIPPGTEVWLGNVPDHLAYAYVFRNAFPWVGAVLGLDQPLVATLDTELADLPPGPPPDLPALLGAPRGAVVLWYDRGVLVRR